MMTSLAQAYTPHPGGIPQHAGMAQSHPMSHNSSHPGQPGPGMSQQMHMGVSGTGPQVTPGQAMLTGIPPGAGGPSPHALQHLNPNQQQQQAQIFQHQAMFGNNPQLQQMHHQQQQQHIIAQQRQQQAQRQAMLAQQYSSLPMNLQNGMPGITPAQFQAIRGQAGPIRQVNLPQHLQAQHAEHNLQQQQAQAHHQQQQMMMVQQMAMRQQGNPHPQNASSQGQPNQMNSQQNQSIQQAQNVLMQQQHQHQQQSQAAAAAAAAAVAASTPHQTQGQQQTLPQPQSNPQVAPPQATPQQQASSIQQQITPALVQQQRQNEKAKGQCLMKLMLFADHLSNFTSTTKPLESYSMNPAHRAAAQGAKQRDDLTYWSAFVERFFSPKGVLRHSLWEMDEKSNKQFEITYPALPRYFHTHFEGGIKGIQLILEKCVEKDLTNNNLYIESPKSSFIYWFDSGSQLVATGTLKVHFDAEQKIDLFEFITSNHEEYLPRTQVLEAARPLHVWGKEWHKVNSTSDGKLSPEMVKKRSKMMKSPPQPPPDIELPASRVKPNMGITYSVFRFLEIAEVLIQMNPLFSYSQQNPNLTPSNALEQYVANISANFGVNCGLQQSFHGSRTPAMGSFSMGVSPAQAHLHMSGGSPHIGSPAQAPGMQIQQSQHGTSSSGPSTNTSPNNNNKRRRPSMVNIEEEGLMNGTHQKLSIKPSPRIVKRQKGNPL